MVLLSSSSKIKLLQGSNHCSFVLMRRLLGRVQQLGRGREEGTNLIAFSGGIDSSVVANAVFKVFPENSLCILGRSSALPREQLELARQVSKHIGIPLKEVFTKEGTSSEYIKNEGQSCYHCKTHLYQALSDIQTELRSGRESKGGLESTQQLTLFNGTNKDDKVDVTRVGLIAAEEFKVASPIDEFTKDEVRALAREFGLPNHAHAASPCLRSRLAWGVHATPDNLVRIEAAERAVKALLSPRVEMNIRVRHLHDSSALIELDKELLDNHADLLPVLAEQVSDLGFRSVRFQPFRSGSVAAASSIKL